MSGYLDFERTGVKQVDAILEALEVAGNNYHHTEMWIEREDEDAISEVMRIQQAADNARVAFEALTRENEVLKSALSTARENALREAAAMARTHRDTQVATLRDWTKRVGDELAADILALALPQKESKE